MKTQPTHTPTPWHVLEHSHGVTITTSPDEIGAWPTCELIASLNECDGDIKANAAFIVRAVNAHEELLDALRWVAEGKGGFSLDPLQHATNTINEMRDVARQAIAKAEGRHD